MMMNPARSLQVHMCTHTLEIQPEPGDLRKVGSLLLCDPARLSVRPLVGHTLPQESLAHHVRLDRVVKVAHVCNRIYGYGVLRPQPTPLHAWTRMVPPTNYTARRKQNCDRVKHH